MVSSKAKIVYLTNETIDSSVFRKGFGYCFVGLLDPSVRKDMIILVCFVDLKIILASKAKATVPPMI